MFSTVFANVDFCACIDFILPQKPNVYDAERNAYLVLAPRFNPRALRLRESVYITHPATRSDHETMCPRVGDAHRAKTEVGDGSQLRGNKSHATRCQVENPEKFRSVCLEYSSSLHVQVFFI